MAERQLSKVIRRFPWAEMPEMATGASWVALQNSDAADDFGLQRAVDVGIGRGAVEQSLRVGRIGQSQIAMQFSQRQGSELYQ